MFLRTGQKEREREREREKKENVGNKGETWQGIFDSKLRFDGKIIEAMLQMMLVFTVCESSELTPL